RGCWLGDTSSPHDRGRGNPLAPRRRTSMAKPGKKFQEAAALLEEGREYTIDEAIELIGKMPERNFDETLEMHARLGIDPRQADQSVRTTVTLPHGSGRQVRVLVF